MKYRRTSLFFFVLNNCLGEFFSLCASRQDPSRLRIPTVWINCTIKILDPDKSKTQHIGLPVVETADGHALNNDAKADEGEATQSNFVLVVPVLLVEIWILQQNTQDCSVADPGCSKFFPSRIRIFPIPDPGSSTKNLSILTQKLVSMLLEI